MARETDLAAVRRIVEAAYAPYVARMGKKPGPMLDDYAARIVGEEVFVAARAGRVLGIVVLIDQADHLLLDNVAVDPEGQGGGIGGRLIAFAETEAARRGYGELRLYTHETMTENVALYPRLGYRETHRVEEKGFSRVYFAKDIPG